ncbi:hypothetical protein [Mesorhizobium sp.]|uniref:hypothetical protein n=1 Tax=Mesorhizobium sp. TaxID=1871066 RepID=UPI000FE7011F|nr:hypothetical protein [Mesorhizobium sp.]RWA84472.1 MAG: hypothetical protein EOQ30_09175 [Mesorhizobium sp.]
MLSIEAGASRSCLLPTESFEKLPLGAKRRPLDRDVARQNDSGGRLRGAPGHQAADLAFALSDRPIGLAAWIAEKFRACSDCGGELERAMLIETLLTDISIYWFSGNIAASLRLYKEMRLQPLTFDAGERVSVPFGVSVSRANCPCPRVPGSNAPQCCSLDLRGWCFLRYRNCPWDYPGSALWMRVNQMRQARIVVVNSRTSPRR